jgi:hypothetical protein
MRRERRAANIRKLKQGPSPVDVQIGELILHGFRAADRYAIGEALSQELHRLILNAEDQSFDRELQVPLHRDQISILSNARPDIIGEKVAQSVHDGLHAIGKGSRV